MIRKTAVFILAVFVCSLAFAADPAISGKITSIDNGKVTIALDGDKAAWVKKNAPVKFNDGIGKIVEVSADGVSPVVIVFKSKKAGSLTVGSEISLQKGKAMAGC